MRGIKGMPLANAQGKHDDDGHGENEKRGSHHSMYSIQSLGLPVRGRHCVTRTRDGLFLIIAINSFTLFPLIHSRFLHYSLLGTGF
jgi:hypothetical protein